MGGWLFAVQALTNFTFAPAGPGLPNGWQLTRVRHANPPSFQLTAGHALRIETDGGAGFAISRLRAPLRPAAGRLTWKWRTATPRTRASLHSRARDDSPVRVFLVFDDRRMLYYTWGDAEPVGDTFLSWTGASRGVLACRRAEDANGSWYPETRDPFEDYRRAFNRAPHPIVAVGVAA
jgi:hypothetical protein